MSTRNHRPRNLSFPNGSTFAFSIFDDTDVATLESIRPIYDLLSELGILTTKTVWPLRYSRKSSFAGSHTLEDEAYAEYIRELYTRGFEIAYHGPTMESSERNDAFRALARFKDVLGTFPRSFASHSMNRDNLYWGIDRFHSRFIRAFYRLTSGESPNHFQGHRPGTEHFWGDLAAEHLEYVRSFTFNGIDLFDATPFVVYRDRNTPFVRAWFTTCDADNVEEFIELLTDENQTRLASQGGLCLVSTHLGKGFVSKGRVIPRVEATLRSIAQRNGWFAPVSTILDHIATHQGIPSLSRRQRHSLDYKWLFHSLLRRRRRRDYQKSELEYLQIDSSPS